MLWPPPFHPSSGVPDAPGFGALGWKPAFGLLGLTFSWRWKARMSNGYGTSFAVPQGGTKCWSLWSGARSPASAWSWTAGGWNWLRDRRKWPGFAPGNLRVNGP
jgi:hypothetical protein